MECVFRKSLLNEIERQHGNGRIEIVEAVETADVAVKVPPQHLMQDKASRHVKQWLKERKAN